MRKEQEKREKQPKCIEETVQGSPHILKNITIYKIPRLGEVWKIQWVFHVVKNILEYTTIIFGHLSKTQYIEGIQMAFCTGEGK